MARPVPLHPLGCPTAQQRPTRRRFIDHYCSIPCLSTRLFYFLLQRPPLFLYLAIYLRSMRTVDTCNFCSDCVKSNPYTIAGYVMDFLSIYLTTFYLPTYLPVAVDLVPIRA